MCIGLESIALVVAAMAVIGVIVYLVLTRSFEFHELLLSAPVRNSTGRCTWCYL